jgi:HSP20 family molecular chaperone IbpA
MALHERVRDGSFEESKGGFGAVPVKLYRTTDLVTVAAPMPGLALEDIEAEVTAEGRLRLHGELADLPDAGQLEDRESKHVLLEEWTAGPYYREVELPAPVDATAATVTYGNGVVVIALPVAERMRPALLVPALGAPTPR